MMNITMILIMTLLITLMILWMSVGNPTLTWTDFFMSSKRIGKRISWMFLSLTGKGHADKFVDWLNRVDTVFECKNIPEHRRVRLIIPKLSEYALIWWNTLQVEREITGKQKISTWNKMKDELMCAFLPPDYEQTVYIRLRDLTQGALTVDEYTEQFSLLMTRANVHESDHQKVGRYIGGLKKTFRDDLMMCDVLYLSTAIRLARRLDTVAADSAVKNSVPSTSTSPTTFKKYDTSAIRCFSCQELGLGSSTHDNK